VVTLCVYLVFVDVYTAVSLTMTNECNNVVDFAVQVSAILLQADDEPELRHRHNDRHLAEHDDDGDGASQRAGATDAGPQLHQPAVHCRLCSRVRYGTAVVTWANLVAEELSSASNPSDNQRK